MKTSVTKEFTFDAAHLLTDYEGACANLHGHTYRLEVTVTGELRNGMIIDFSVLKDVVKREILDKVDHRMLNDVLDFRTTAENMAEWMMKAIQSALPGRVYVTRIRLWETPTSYAEVTT